MDLNNRRVPASNGAANAARGSHMTAWLRLVASLMVAVLLWTANVAHAAEAFGCVEVSAEAPGHFDGDPDQTPADTDKAVPHHHGGGCHGHHNAMAADDDDAPATASAPALLDRWSDLRVSGRGPPAALRPPIA